MQNFKSYSKWPGLGKSKLYIDRHDFFFYNILIIFFTIAQIQIYFSILITTLLNIFVIHNQKKNTFSLTSKKSNHSIQFKLHLFGLVCLDFLGKPSKLNQTEQLVVFFFRSNDFLLQSRTKMLCKHSLC